VIYHLINSKKQEEEEEEEKTPTLELGNSTKFSFQF